MTEPTKDSAVNLATALLVHYGFDMGRYKAEELIDHWLNDYPANWLRLAVVEALYQGRYKAVSVQQILGFWLRRGRPSYHFNHEFERLICRKFPQNLFEKPTITKSEEINFPVVNKSTDYNVEVSQAESSSSEVISTITYTYPAKREIIRKQEVPETTPDSRDIEISSQPNSTIFTQQLVTQPEFEVPASQVSLEPLTISEQSNSELPHPETDQSQNDELTFSYELDWSGLQASKHPIHQFTPPPDASDFYLKLKSVAHVDENSSPQSVSEGVGSG